MDPIVIELFEPAVVLFTLLGVAFCTKVMFWGRGPIRRGRAAPQLEERLADLEDRWDQSAELIARQQEQITDLEERLDFAERMLTRGAEVEEEPAATPV